MTALNPTFRFATLTDVPLLAGFNKQLIVEEKHRNCMTPPELEDRMRTWLSTGEYQAVLFLQDDHPAGYALFRRDGADIYLRQFLVCTEFRRQGLGRAAIAWLRTRAWQAAPRIRVEALIHNAPAITFYRALGFGDYCLTMELEQNG